MNDIDKKNLLLIALVIAICLVLFYFIKKCPNSTPKGIAVGSILDDEPTYKEVDFDKLTEGEKLQYLSDMYFGKNGEGPSESKEEDEEAKRKKANAEYVSKLTFSNEGCEDKYEGCSNWANNDECKINPEFMLYGCSKSCKACKLTEDEKSNLVKIYNTYEPSHCVYHGSNYPGNFPYLNTLYNYTIARII